MNWLITSITVLLLKNTSNFILVQTCDKILLANEQVSPV